MLALSVVSEDKKGQTNKAQVILCFQTNWKMFSHLYMLCHVADLINILYRRPTN